MQQIYLLIAILNSFIISAICAKSKTITASVDATWAQTSFIAEARFEFILLFIYFNFIFQ